MSFAIGIPAAQSVHPEPLQKPGSAPVRFASGAATGRPSRRIEAASALSAAAYGAQTLAAQYAWHRPRWKGNSLPSTCKGHDNRPLSAVLAHIHILEREQRLSKLVRKI